VFTNIAVVDLFLWFSASSVHARNASGLNSHISALPMTNKKGSPANR
jgi:hypothetical protein